MNQSSVIFGALLAGFVLFLAARGKLKAYTAVLWGDTAARLPSTTVGAIPIEDKSKGGSGGGGGGLAGLPSPGGGTASGLTIDELISSIPELVAAF